MTKKSKQILIESKLDKLLENQKLILIHFARENFGICRDCKNIKKRNWFNLCVYCLIKRKKQNPHYFLVELMNDLEESL